MKIAIWIAIVVVAIVALGRWTAERDREMSAAVLAYEACVQREYGMTPLKWYEDHKQYPSCGN